MSTQIAICNQALIKVGSDPIISLTDATKGAITLSAIYDIQRDAELAAHPWTFAIKRAQIPASTTAPAFGFAYAYPLPSDYLGLVQVGEDWSMYAADAAGETYFSIEGGSILTDEASPLSIRYIFRVTNTAAFAPLFAEAFACRLALELAEPLSASSTKRQLAQDGYDRAISRARRMNSIEQPPRLPPESTWWTARDS